MQKRTIVLLTSILIVASFTDFCSFENIKAEVTSTFENEHDISSNYFNFTVEYPTNTDVNTTIQTDFSLIDRSEKKWNNKRYFDITATEAKQMIDRGYIATVIDIRNSEKYNYYHIDGAINIPLQEFECESCLFNTLYESKNNLMIVYSQRGEKSKYACDFLIESGFKKVFNMVDGLDNWIDKGFAIIESSDINNVSILENNTKYYTGAIFEDPSEVPEKLYPLSGDIGLLGLPSELDWSNYNGKDWTSPVKNQGSCGSCWAFAALGTLESIINIREGQPDYDLDLSEQYILSCLPSAGSCDGGGTYRALKYIMNTSEEGNYCNGIIPEFCMPYEADDSIPCDDKCPNWEDTLIPIMDYGIEYNPSIERIKQLLLNNGPGAVSFAVYDDFYFYPGNPSYDENGVYQYDGFSEHSGGHAVTLVGYKDTPGNPNYSGYWICKNSWGSTWGPWNNGFFGIAYGDCYIDNSIIWVEYGARVPQISIDIHRIKKIDPIEYWWWDQADWYYSVSIETDDGESQSIIYHCPENDDDTLVNEVHTFSIDGLNATIKIKLMERDSWPGADDLADISGYIGGGVDDSTPNSRGAIYYGYYALKNGYLSGDITYPDGYYLKTSGDYSPDNSTTTDQNDAKIWFNITDNYEVPIANIGPNITVTAGEMVFFDASDSTASLGSILILYEWDWDNDGIFEESHTSPIANHSWTESENHTVILRVTDNFNETSTDSCQITVDPSRPIASFSYLPSNPFVNETIIFNASSSYDLDGTIDLYMWDWDNNGIFDEFYLTPIAFHSFSTVGDKYVTLKVVDNDGDNDTFTDLIQVFQARFTDYFDDYGLDTDNDGLYNYLVVEAEVEVMEAGEYELFGRLWYYNESSGWWNSIDYDHNYTDLDAGVYTISLEFEGYDIYNNGYSGSFKVDLDLYDTINWNWIDDEEYMTQSYNYTDFERPTIEFTGLFEDYGLDTDLDTLYNYLVVEAEIEVFEAGNYRLSGDLYYYNDSLGWWYYFDYESNYAYLDVGIQTISLEFDGYKIYNLGYNGSFKASLDLYETTEWIKMDEADYITNHYDYTEFQRLIPDDYEPDDDYLNATLIATDGMQQYHDFHVPGDQDWMKFNANEDISYIIETSDLGNESDTYMYLYASDGVTEITHDDDGGAGLASRIIWDCSLSGSYYIKVRHYGSTACGPDTHYNISVLEWIPPAEFTDNFNNYGLDNDGNGLFDYLVIAAEINVSQAEEFYFSGELNHYNEIDGTWDWFGCYAWNHSYLDIGIHTVLLEFNGHTINNLGYNGTFRADISLENNLDQLDYAEHYTNFYNYTDFQEPDTIPPNITDVHVPDYVGLYHPGNLSANISDNNLQLVSMMLYDYYNITFNQSIVIWYYLDDSGESGTYVVSEYAGTYTNLEQTENSTPASLIMLSNWTQNDKVYMLANFKKNQTASWTQIFLEFNLSNGLLNNLAIPSISQLEYITNLIEPGASIVYPFALIFNNGWTVLNLNCNYTLYTIGDPNNPYLSFSPLENGEYTGLIQAQDTEYNMNSTSYNLSVNHSLPLNNPPNTPSNPHPPNGSTDAIITPMLSWTGGDPDPGDTITYDVYFGTSISPPKIWSNQSGTSFNLGTLNYSTTYYWKIVAWDNHSAFNASEIWSFTTVSGSPVFIWVDDDYDTSTPGWQIDHFDKIQDGIDAASPGNTVYVYNGTYDDLFMYGGHFYVAVIDKQINLIGENKYSTIIDSQQIGFAGINVVAGGVNITGFTVKNSNSDSFSSGIRLSMVILVDLSDNIFSNNMIGIYLTNAQGNTIYSNYIESNFRCGIYLSPFSYGNLIYDNYFENSANAEVYIDPSVWDSRSVWFIQKTPGNNIIGGPYLGGNYWSDYYGSDNDGDGIGDTEIPYILGGVWDELPLVNIPPTANFTFLPAVPTTEDVIQFADESYDLDGVIVSWSWDFGDGNISTEQNPTHQFSDNITYNVTLLVTDDGGASDFISKNVSVFAVNIPPVADFSFTPATPTINDLTQFTDESYDLDGVIVSWSWDFGDGNISTEQNPTHQFSDNITYNVTLLVTDDTSATDTILKQIITKVVHTIFLPPNNETVVDLQNETDTIVTINITTSTTINISKYSGNPTGQNISANITSVGNYIDIEVENESAVIWPMNITIFYTYGDLNTSNLTENHLVGIYFWNDTTGEWQLYDYTGVNTTYDQNGYEGYCWAEVYHLTPLTLGGEENQPPAVSISTPSGGTVSGIVSVTGTASDPDGDSQLQKVQIRIGGGSWIDVSGTTSWSYSWDTNSVSNGGHIIYARAYDGTDYSNIKSVSVTVDNGGGEEPPSNPPPPPPPSNARPIANASADEPYVGFVGEEIIFNGSLSYDPDDDGYIKSWLWDFGDGTNGTGEIITHTYSSRGTYAVILTVIDNEGAEDTYETTAVIILPNIPPSDPIVNGTQIGKKDTTYRYTAVSADPENDTIRYFIDWDDGTNTTSDFLTNGTALNATHNWLAAGIYLVTVYAMDENNATSGTTELLVLIDVHYCSDIGYLIDSDSNDIYDLFHCNETGEQTVVEQNEGSYLIDSDGDGNWDYIYDSVNETISLLGEKEGEKEMVVEILWIIGAAAIVVIAIIGIILFLRTKKNNSKKK